MKSLKVFTIDTCLNSPVVHAWPYWMKSEQQVRETVRHWLNNVTTFNTTSTRLFSNYLQSARATTRTITYLNQLSERRSVIGRAEARHERWRARIANGVRSTSKNATISTNRRARSDSIRLLAQRPRPLDMRQANPERQRETHYLLPCYPIDR